MARNRTGRLRLAEQLLFGRQQQTSNEVLAMTLERRFHARKLHDVGADAKDHLPSRPSIINRFISRTARGKPSNTARATMAWPILSSTISRMAATGCTLW